MEYTKQLILSCLLSICQKLSAEGSKGTRVNSEEQGYGKVLWGFGTPCLKTEGLVF